jgi:phage terminase small subunit
MLAFIVTHLCGTPALRTFVSYIERGEDAVTPKQKRFCDEYLIDCNATQAAIRAGYSEKTAYSIGQRLLKDVEVSTYIEERLLQMQNKSIADATEVMQYLTSVLRGESKSSVLSLCGDGCQEVIEKNPDEKEKLKAAELLAKRYGLLTDKFNVEGTIPVVISGDDELED